MAEVSIAICYTSVTYLSPGWVVGGHDSENGMSRSVCVKNRMVVISVDYRR